MQIQRSRRQADANGNCTQRRASFRAHVTPELRASPAAAKARGSLAFALGYPVSRRHAADRIFAAPSPRVRPLLPGRTAHPADTVAARLAVAPARRNSLPRSRACRRLRALRERGQAAWLGMGRVDAYG